MNIVRMLLAVCCAMPSLAFGAVFITGSLSDVQLFENASVGNNTVTVSVTLTTDLNLPNSVALRITPQGQNVATPGVDYTAPSQVNVAYHSTVGGMRVYNGSFVVQGLPDAIYEPSERIALLVYRQGGASNEGTFLAEMMLRDGTDKPLITLKSNDGNSLFSTDAYEAGALPTHFILERSRVIDAITTVKIVIGGTATNGEDYNFVTDTYTFLRGQTQKIISIQPIDDALYEDVETVRIKLLGGSIYYDVAPLGEPGETLVFEANIISDDPVPTPTPTPTPEPSPTPGPTPRPLPTMQPERVFGLYTPKVVQYSPNNGFSMVAHGPVMSLYDHGYSKFGDLNNLYGDSTGASDVYYQDVIQDMAISQFASHALVTNGTEALLWNLNTKNLDRTFSGGQNDQDMVTKVAIYAGLDLAVTGASTVRVWSLSQGTLLGQLALNGAPVTSLAFSHDGSMLFASSEVQAQNASARVWSMPSRLPLATLSFPTGVSPTSAAFTRDGQKLIVGSSDQRITIYDTQRWVPLYRINTLTAVYTVAASPDNTTFAANDGGGIRFWTQDNYQPLFQLKPPEIIAGDAKSISFSPDGGKLAAAYDGGKAGVVYWILGEENPHLIPTTFDVTQHELVPGGENIVLSKSVNEDGPAIYSLATGRQLRILEKYEAPEVETPEGEEPPPPPPPQELVEISISGDGKRLATLTSDFGTTDMLRIHDLATGEIAINKIYGARHLNTIDLSFDGKEVLGGTVDGIVGLYDDTSTTEALEAFEPPHEGPVTDVEFAKADQFALSASEDKLVNYYSVSSGLRLLRLDHDLHEQAVNHVHFNPVRPELMSATDSYVSIWNTDTGLRQKVSTIARGDGIYYVDGARVISSATADNSMILWHTESEKINARYLSVLDDESPIRDYSVSPNGSHFFARGGTIDGADTVWMWKIDLPETAAQSWQLYP